MHVSALDRIVLNVADIERSLAFYEQCLGMSAERADEWRRGELPYPSVRINEATLIDLVGVDHGSLTMSAPLRLNVAQICLVIDDNEFTALTAHLERAGASVEEGPVIRSGARGNAISISFRDPDCNLVEVRTYARRPLLRMAIDDARRLVRDAIDATHTPHAAVVGNEAWTHKDLLAHLTSIEGWFRKQIEIAVYARPWDFESVHDFNARAVAERHDWSLQALTQELEQEAAALQALLETLDESDLNRVIQHPQRQPRKLADGWMMLHSHARKHVAELAQSGRQTGIA